MQTTTDVTVTIGNEKKGPLGQLWLSSKNAIF